MSVTKDKLIETLHLLFMGIENSYTLSVEDKYHAIKPFLPKGSDIFASQEGEDILLKRLLKSRCHSKGFYVDVGAYDPIRFSNTFHFYLQGWRGINIDPNPATKDSFDIVRPGDINICMGVSNKKGCLEYHMFEEGAFNTFSSDQAQTVIDSSKSSYMGIKEIEVDCLSTILAGHLPEKQTISYMNVDVEGWEIEVLESNDWSQFRPYFISIEALNDQKYKFIDTYLGNVGYIQVAKTKNTLFFARADVYEDLENDVDIDISLIGFEESAIKKSSAEEVLVADSELLKSLMENQSIQVKNKTIEKKNAKIQEQSSKLAEVRELVQSRNEVIQEQSSKLAEVRALVQSRDEVIQEQSSKLAEVRVLVQSRDEVIQEQSSKLAEVRALVQSRDEVIQEQSSKLAEVRALVQSRNEVIQEQSSKLAEVRELVQSRDDVIQEQSSKLAEVRELVQSRDAVIEEQSSKLVEVREVVQSRDALIEEQSSELVEVRGLVQSRDAVIQEQSCELAEIKNSNIYQILLVIVRPLILIKRLIK